MGRVTRPQMEIVKFGTEDVIATSGIPFYPIFSKSINDLSTGERFLILNGEGLKSFSDWAGYHHDEYSADTFFSLFFQRVIGIILRAMIMKFPVARILPT